MRKLRQIRSGEWQDASRMEDYRSEWFGDMLVERATWGAQASTRRLEDVVVARPGYIWFRFWIPDADQIVDKYFDGQGEEIGFCVPVSAPLQRSGGAYHTTDLILTLWLDTAGGLVVLREADYERAMVAGMLTSAQVERAEVHFRDLTAAIARNRFPPPLVRDLQLAPPQGEQGRDYDRHP